VTTTCRAVSAGRSGRTSAACRRECAPGEARGVRVAWKRQPGEDPYLVREPLFSYGVGLRMNVYYAVLRLDHAFPVNRPERGGRSGIYALAFGPSFRGLSSGRKSR
jgi:hypothetical protein